MSPVPSACAWEASVAAAALSPDWPADAAESISNHIGGCASCREVAAVASMLGAAEAAPRARRVPDAAVVWHRAQMRARREDAEDAVRPIVWMQIAAAAIVLLLILLWAGNATRLVSDGASRLWGAFSLAVDAARGTIAEAREEGTVLGIGRTVLAILTVALVLIATAFGLSRLADKSVRP